MLIGIDMLGVQSPEGARRESGRYGRGLVSALLERDPARRYILYVHEGMPTDRIPSARNAHRVSLAPVPGGSSGLRPTIQRVVDQNPDGLDWLVLLDPFEPNYGGVPPESPLNSLKVASVVLDLAPSRVDDRRLASIRRHDAILAVSEATAVDCRRRLGPSCWQVSTLGVAVDPKFAGVDASGPLTRASCDELGRLGISGPFLLADVSGGADRANLVGILDAYARLPFEHQRRHQLAIAGPLDDPWGVVGYLHERGCSEGLVLVGEVDEPTLRTLLGRCSAYLSPSTDGRSGLPLVEAMRCGAPVIAGKAGSQPEVVGDAGLLADPLDAAEIAETLGDLLSDIDLERDLRARALARASAFAWAPVVDACLARFDGRDEPTPRPGLRFDRAHAPRPRVALFPEVDLDAGGRIDLSSQVPDGWRRAYNVDLYVEATDSALVEGLPSEFGGFDARQFERNDGLLGYHAVAYQVGGPDALASILGRLRGRPGLVTLRADAWLGRSPRDPAWARLRDAFLTRSIVVVPSPWLADRLRLAMPEFAGRVVEVPPSAKSVVTPLSGREAARANLGVSRETLLVGLFGEVALDARALAKLPGVGVLAIDGPDRASIRLAVGDRSPARPADPRRANARASAPAEGPRERLAALDLAILGDGPAPLPLLDLIRAGIPTIAPGLMPSGPDEPDRPTVDAEDDLAATVARLASDPLARSELARLAFDYAFGTPAPVRASALLLEQVERCASELPRGQGRGRRASASGSTGPIPPPHTPRRSPTPDEAASRSR